MLRIWNPDEKYDNSIEKALRKGYYEDLKVFEKDGLYGYVDKNNQIVIHAIYTKAYDFSEGLAQVIKEDENGNWLTIFIDQTGNEIIKFDEYIESNDFSEGLILGRKGEKTVCFDKSGNLVFECETYAEIYPFHDGLARVKKMGKNSSSRLYGFINKKGEEVIPCQYKFAYDFHDGVAAVGGDSWFYIDTDGAELKDLERFYFAHSFQDGLALVCDYTYGYQIINKDFEVVVSLSQYKFVDNFELGIAKVMSSKDLYGFIDINGNEIIPCIYKEIGYFNNDGVAKATTYDGEKVEINISDLNLGTLKSSNSNEIESSDTKQKHN